MASGSRKLNVVITGGGTGGHIYPAIAVAQKLKLDKDIDKIFYIGCPFNMEKDIALGEGLEFLPISVHGMPRKSVTGLISWFVELNKAVRQSISYLYRIKPDVILGTGGYVSGPVLLAAIILRIPFVIHDSDARPGIVSRFIAPWAKVVFVAFEQARDYLNSKNIVVNGNPIRSSFSNISKEQALINLGLKADKKTLLVMGGSQGAKSINNAMLDAVPELIGKYDIQIIHQTGKKNFDEYIEKFTKKYGTFLANSSYLVKPYFDDMSVPLAAADLVISRAGSLSISELNLSAKPSILVPYPFAAADHQRYNARAMEQSGASVYLEDADCNSENFIRLISDLLSDEDKLFKMSEANKSLAKPHSTDNLISMMKNVVLC